VTHDELDEVAVRTEDDGTSGAHPLENLLIVRLSQPEITHRDRVDAQPLAHPFGQGRHQLRVHPDGRHALCGEHRMPKPPTRKAQAGRDVLGLEIRQLNHDVIDGQPGGERIEDVADADAHPADARAPAALIGVHGDAIHQLYSLTHTPHSGGIHRNLPDRDSAQYRRPAAVNEAGFWQCDPTDVLVLTIPRAYSPDGDPNALNEQYWC
jgi:hypothetical protein